MGHLCLCMDGRNGSWGLWYPRSQNVQFHDILYTLFREMLYTSARALASAEV